MPGSNAPVFRGWTGCIEVNARLGTEALRAAASFAAARPGPKGVRAFRIWRAAPMDERASSSQQTANAGRCRPAPPPHPPPENPRDVKLHVPLPAVLIEHVSMSSLEPWRRGSRSWPSTTTDSLSAAQRCVQRHEVAARRLDQRAALPRRRVAFVVLMNATWRQSPGRGPGQPPAAGRSCRARTAAAPPPPRRRPRRRARPTIKSSSSAKASSTPSSFTAAAAASSPESCRSRCSELNERRRRVERRRSV